MSGRRAYFATNNRTCTCRSVARCPTWSGHPAGPTRTSSILKRMCEVLKGIQTGRPGLVQFGTVTAATGIQVGLWLAAPPIAVALTCLEAILIMIVIVTALYASQRLSDRAFRILPWIKQQSKSDASSELKAPFIREELTYIDAFLKSCLLRPIIGISQTPARAGAGGAIRRLHSTPTLPVQAQRPQVRALCGAFPSRSPLPPARMRSLRAASVFPTSPPH
jgi:hypothetical protein